LPQAGGRAIIATVGPSWDDFRFLLALRRTGSLGAAARSLKIDTSTVSRRIASLEAALGIQLVVRTPDGVKFNEAGVLASEAAEAVDGTLRALEARIGGADQRPQGVVRVSVTDGFASLVFEGLAALRAREPGICVELVVSTGRADLARGEADIAIRLFRETSGDLVARKVATLAWSLYAGASYVERRGGGPRPDEVASCDVVAFAEAAGRSPGARWLETHAPGAKVAFRANSVSAAVQAVRAGLGLSVLPCFMADREPSLQRLTPEVLCETEAFLVVHPSVKEIARVRTVLDALGDLFAREAGVLGGRAASS
jgi:DNA-binding transcriptional LysR family regulator